MRTFAAMFDSRAEAEAVQRQLEQLGVIDADGMNIYDRSTPGFSRDAYSTHQNRGFWASLKNAFLPDEDRHTYEEGVRRGGYLLTVEVDDAQADRVHDILDNSNAVDVDERASQWRREGWTAPAATTGAAYAADTSTTGTSTTGTMRESDRGRGEDRIPIIEEQLRVGKREVERSGVRVRSYVVEEPVHEQVALREEHVSVERRPVDQRLDAGDLEGDTFRERNIEVTETSEEAVVAKEARVREEVVVRKDVEERIENIDDTVRRTEVDIDDHGRRLAAGGGTGRDTLGRDASDTDRDLDSGTRGMGDEAMGNAKQGLGGMTGDEKLRREGRDQERSGEAQRGRKPDRF